MAYVQIADIYDPLIFNGAVQEAAIENNRFVQSGVMTPDSTLGAMASGPGQVGELPFFYGLTNDEPDYVDDDATHLAVPAKITSSKQVYMSAHQHKSWSTMDLARELALQDPLSAITSRIGKYWAVSTEKRLINSLAGILLDNVANDASDMTNDIFIEDGDNALAANLISAEAVIDAVATAGDHHEVFTTIAMHSVPYFTLVKADLIDFVADSSGRLTIPTYLGKRVVVDDSLAPRAGTTSGYVYTTVLFANGVVAYGSGSPEKASELERVPNAGYGGGQDIIHTRTTEIVHPYGFSFNTAGPAAQSATYAELATVTNWNRVVGERKNVGIAFLRTNG